MKKVYLIALIAALAAGGLLYFYLSNLEKQKVVEVEMEPVLVASVDIAAHTAITQEMLQLSEVPKGTAHPLAARSAEEVIGSVTDFAILAGEQIIPTKLKITGDATSGLSYNIPSGMRALTIAVDPVSGVGLYIQKGDYVDVLAHVSTSHPQEAYQEEAPQLATTLLAAQNVVVAETGTEAEKANALTAGVTLEYTTITLIVTPEDAMRIVQASRSGVISVLLRATGDHQANTEPPIGNDSLLTNPK